MRLAKRAGVSYAQEFVGVAESRVVMKRALTKIAGYGECEADRVAASEALAEAQRRFEVAVRTELS